MSRADEAGSDAAAQAWEEPPRRRERRRRDRPSTEAALVRAATTLFAERGYDATTTRAVAEAAGCSEALIQNYFGGKEGLLLGVMRTGDGWDKYLAFFRRPLCASIEQDALEHLTYVLKGLADRAPLLRIVMSRALVDPAFQPRFGEFTLRRHVVDEVMARYERYREAGMVADPSTMGSVVEWLVDTGFNLGFIQAQLVGIDPARLAARSCDIAKLFARAVQPGGA